MKRKEKISVCIAYAMLSKIRKLKVMSGQGDKFRIPWKMLQSYEHLHREKTRQLVDEYLYIKKACHDCLEGYTNYLIDNKSWIVSSNSTLKDSIKKADMEGYLIPDTRLQLLQASSVIPNLNSEAFATTPKGSKEDAGNLSEIENLDSPEEVCRNNNEDKIIEPILQKEDSSNAFETTSPSDSCNNFEIDVREVYSGIYQSVGVYQQLLATENATKYEKRSKEELSSMKVFSCISDEEDNRCMLELKTNDSTEFMFLQILIEKLDEIAKIKKCSYKDVLATLNKNDVNIAKLYGSLRALGK